MLMQTVNSILTIFLHRPNSVSWNMCVGGRSVVLTFTTMPILLRNIGWGGGGVAIVRHNMVRNRKNIY